MANLNIPGGLTGKVGLYNAAVLTIALKSYTDRPRTEVKLRDIATTIAKSTDDVGEILKELQSEGLLELDGFDPDEVSSFYVDSVSLKLSPAQYAASFRSKATAPANRNVTGEDTFTVDGCEYLAVVEEDREGFHLEITREEDDKLVVDQHFATREEARAWADEWASHPVRLDAPDKPGRWIHYIEEIDSETNEVTDALERVVVVTEVDGCLYGQPEDYACVEDPCPITAFPAGEWALIPEPEIEWVPAPFEEGLWIRNAGGFEAAMVVRILDEEFCASVATEDGAPSPVADMDARWRKATASEKLSIELFGEHAEAEPAPDEPQAELLDLPMITGIWTVLEDGSESSVEVGANDLGMVVTPFAGDPVYLDDYCAAHPGAKWRLAIAPPEPVVAEDPEQNDIPPDVATQATPKKRGKKKAQPSADRQPSTFTVTIEVEGVGCEIDVEHTPNYLTKGDAMDRFYFTPSGAMGALGAQIDPWEKLVASERVPTGQPLYEYAAGLAQRHVSGGEE